MSDETTTEAVTRALRMVQHTNVYEVEETQIADAIADLLHLAWHCTNEDGDGLTPEQVIDNALMHFEAERTFTSDLSHIDLRFFSIPKED